MALIYQAVFINTDYLEQLPSCSAFIHDIFIPVVHGVEFRAADRDNIDRSLFIIRHPAAVSESAGTAVGMIMALQHQVH